MAKDLSCLFATIDPESVEQFKASDRIKESIRWSNLSSKTLTIIPIGEGYIFKESELRFC
jgi:hypothetical protein